MLIQKNFNGSLVASDIIPTDKTGTNKIRVHRIYSGYTMKEARSDFSKHIKTLIKNTK